MLRNLSLRYKFLGLIAALLSAAIFIYLFLAIRLFDADKTAFIYEGQSTLAATLADQAQTRLDALERIKRILSNTAAGTQNSVDKRQEVLESIIVTDSNIVDFKFFQDSEEVAHIINPNFVEKFDIEPELIANLYNADPIDTNISDNTFANTSNLGDMPVLRIISPISANDESYTSIMHVAVNDLIATFSRSQENTSYLITESAEVLVHGDVKQVINKSIMDAAYIDRILGSTSLVGAMQTEHDAESIIVSYSHLQGYPMYVVSQIPKWKAFIASTRLKEKSLYFALLILIVSFMASILFTKTLTSALQRLHAAATEISKGNFEIRVKARGRDEIGTLSKSFNFMAGRIIQLMKETADKARMEKELETAQLVQENFFPVDTIQEGKIDLTAHFEAASECGGDWWGHIRKPDGRLVVLIGDATGHGVPSALITAAAHACCTTIQDLSQSNAYDMTPAELMTTLNKTVFAAGRGSVKMTFFIAEIDQQHGVLTYANASHELPVISRKSEDNPEKRDRSSLDTLDGEPGNILGESAKSQYQNYSYELSSGDVLVWYTDGLTECRNNKGDEFGENRLIRSVLKHAHESSEEIRKNLLTKANDFNSSPELEDDITVVVMSYDHQAEIAHKAAG